MKSALKGPHRIGTPRPLQGRGFLFTIFPRASVAPSGAPLPWAITLAPFGVLEYAVPQIEASAIAIYFPHLPPLCPL